MKPTFVSREDVRALLLCALYSFVLLFFLSQDSYIRDLFYRCDSAWFFMCGKAWMNGLTPYVDFADSKGPLLWLIYGVGYLLSPHSYVGVFWLSVVSYTATLFVAYKTCRLFIDARMSALSLALLPIVLFFGGIHNEVRAEDFCNLFVMLSLYALCRTIGRREDRMARVLAVSMGVSFMCCFLIKWNIAVMLCAPMAIVLYLSIKRGVGATCLGGMTIGAMAVALPFLVYFLLFADLGALVQEYFVNTVLTMRNCVNVISGGLRAIFYREAFVMALFMGVALFAYRHRSYAWLLPCFVWFRLCFGGTVRMYYLSILTPFALFFAIAAVPLVLDRVAILQRYAPICCLLSALVALYNVKYVNYIYRNAAADRVDYYRALYVMSQVDKPRVWNRSLEYGVGVAVDALPACRYWANQNGATQAMKDERNQALREGKPDFVFSRTSDDEEFRAEVEQLGYERYGTLIAERTDRERIVIYGRPGLRLPPPDFTVSDWDIYLKRNIFGI